MNIPVTESLTSSLSQRIATPTTPLPGPRTRDRDEPVWSLSSEAPTFPPLAAHLPTASFIYVSVCLFLGRGREKDHSIKASSSGVGAELDLGTCKPVPYCSELRHHPAHCLWSIAV